MITLEPTLDFLFLEDGTTLLLAEEDQIIRASACSLLSASSGAAMHGTTTVPAISVATVVSKSPATISAATSLPAVPCSLAALASVAVGIVSAVTAATLPFARVVGMGSAAVSASNHLPAIPAECESLTADVSARPSGLLLPGVTSASVIQSDDAQLRSSSAMETLHCSVSGRVDPAQSSLRTRSTPSTLPVLISESWLLASTRSMATVSLITSADSTQAKLVALATVQTLPASLGVIADTVTVGAIHTLDPLPSHLSAEVYAAGMHAGAVSLLTAEFSARLTAIDVVSSSATILAASVVLSSAVSVDVDSKSITRLATLPVKSVLQSASCETVAGGVFATLDPWQSRASVTFARGSVRALLAALELSIQVDCSEAAARTSKRPERVWTIEPGSFVSKAKRVTTWIVDQRGLIWVITQGKNMATEILRKQPSESIVFAFDFRQVLSQVGSTIASVVSVTATPAGLTLTEQEVQGNGDGVNVRIAGGSSGQMYKVSVSVVLASGSILEADGKLYVRDS